MAKFDRNRIRMMTVVDGDPGRPLFDSALDVSMLLAFLERFERLGWMPPRTQEQIDLLAAHDVIRHERDEVVFYEFRSRGARDDRVPPLTVYFHVDAGSGLVRITGLQRTDDSVTEREKMLNAICQRVKRI